ncbi:LiaI-LiaF-like domain-containing protein [Oceanobacillus sp. FSL H7-0719]|uniref:LiaI-LiaF-like domain-containing protein n=1 Tax=Oceanobacillus sp. FSL H7-0719 TaxID=2954507 RepID=UPI003254EC0E
MKKQNALFAYILIGIGFFFLFRELKLPIFTNFYSWQTLLIIIGAAILIHSYRAKSYENIFIGILILGIGIHLHGAENYHFWIDHWAIYLIIIGLAFLLRAMKTKSGMLAGILFLAAGVLLIYSQKFSAYFSWIYDIFALLDKFWPIVLILVGIILLRKGK